MTLKNKIKSQQNSRNKKKTLSASAKQIDINPFLEFQKQNKIFFLNQDLLIQAFTHSSFTNEGFLASYERLEFLGDAILELVVSEYLFFLPENKNEGILSKLKSYLVNENTLGEIAESLLIGDYMLMSVGEEKSGGRKRLSILADVVESLIAAIYLDQGYNIAKEFIIKNLHPFIIKANQTIIFQDFKSYLQEYAQQKYTTIPEYTLIKESGPEHEKIFSVAVLINKLQLGHGVGSSKKKAEQEAAKNALMQLGFPVS